MTPDLNGLQLDVLQALDQLGAHDVIAAVGTGKTAGRCAHSLSVTAHILRGLARIQLVDRVDLDDAQGYYLTTAGLERVRQP